ncbi:MAG: glycosyltransferase family 39 protein, partial [Lentisphaerae bacterium]|nr:glycosyltransferase family 39 protein [Lentisphaerota bacterium]
HDLWRPAEPREAAIAREMIESGNWVATYLNGQLFLEKPPLYTWTMAGMMKIFGYKDWPIRIPVLLFTCGLLILTYSFAYRELDSKGAVLSVVAVATMSLFLEVNHGAMIDNGLMFFTMLSLYAFYRCFEIWQNETSRNRFHKDPLFGWATLFYLGLGLAFLCKGIIGPALVLAPIAGFVIFGKRWRIIPRIYPIYGSCLALFVVACWLFALWLKGGSHYFNVFFMDNHVKRFTGDYGPKEAPFYYIPYIFLAPLPWTILLVPAIAALRERMTRVTPGKNAFWTFAFWWIGSMFVMLSIAGTKDSQYLLPLLPAFGFIYGMFVKRTLSGDPFPRWWAVFIRCFCIVGSLAILATPFIPVARSCPLGFSSILMGAILLSVTINMLVGLFRNQWQGVWIRMAILIIGAGICLHLFVEPVLNEMKSSRPAWEFIQENVPESADLTGIDLDENTQGFMYYYGRAPRILETNEEIVKAARSENDSYILVIERRKNYPPIVEDLVATGQWQLHNEAKFEHRLYRLLKNRKKH